MRPHATAKHPQHQQHLYLHSNSVGTFSTPSQQQQYLLSPSSSNNSGSGGLFNKPILKSSSFEQAANNNSSGSSGSGSTNITLNQRPTSPNTSHDNIINYNNNSTTGMKNRSYLAAPKSIENKEISKWSCQDVGVWLDWMKLSHLKQIFIQNQISGDELLELTDAEIINDLKVKDENERKIIKDLIENREVWIPLKQQQGTTTFKKSSNDSLDSLEEYPKQISPIGMMNQQHSIFGPRVQDFKKPIPIINTGASTNCTLTNTKSSLELDEFSDCDDDLTSVGGIFLDRLTIGSQKLEIVLESLYKDIDSVKFKVYRGNDIHLITQKRANLSFTSLKLEIIERYQCVKPSILYKMKDGDNIRINRDEDLARVISTYHQNGGDVSQPIKLQIETESPLTSTTTNATSTTTTGGSSSIMINNSNAAMNQLSGSCSSSNNGMMMHHGGEWSCSSSDHSHTSSNGGGVCHIPHSNNQLAQKLIELELDNIEKTNSIRELEIRAHNQQVENEKQINFSKSLQDEISSLKMQLYSYKNGTVFNPSGSLSRQEEINEYIKLCKSLQVSVSTAQNKLFELLGTNQL